MPDDLPTAPEPSFEYPGRYYEVIRAQFRDLAAETEYLAGRLDQALADGDRPVGGARVLDLGCGTGQTLRALAQARPGLRAVGVDQSAAFIKHAAAFGGADFHRGLIEDFDAAAEFDLVVSVFGSLNGVHRPALPAVLARVADWLAPHGRLVLDAAHLLNAVESFQPSMVAHHRAGGVRITRLCRQVLNPHQATWRNEETLLVDDPAAGSPQVFDNVVRQSVLTVPELRDLLGHAGLAIEALHGGFRGEPAPPHGRGPLILVARRA